MVPATASMVRLAIQATAASDIPIVGQIADAADAVWSLTEGDYAGAWMSAGGIVMAGMSQAKMARAVARGVNEVVDVAKAVNSSAHLATEGANLFKASWTGGENMRKLDLRSWKMVDSDIGNLTAAKNKGEMIGRRVVREWNPATGRNPYLDGNS